MIDSNILAAIEQIKTLSESRDYWKALAQGNVDSKEMADLNFDTAANHIRSFA